MQRGGIKMPEQTSMPAHRVPPKMKQAKAQGIDFALDLVYRIISGKDRLNFGSVTRKANWFQVLSFAPPPVQPFEAEGRTVKW